MAEQIIPQWQINQIFTLSPEATTRRLRALLVGPAYRVSQAIGGGQYTGGEVSIDWPDRPAGGVVDQDYTSVWFNDAALRYADIGPAEEVEATDNVLRAPGSTFNWKDNPGFPRNSAIPFDPKIGDWVRVSAGGESFITSVQGFDGDADPATPDVGAAVAGSANAVTQAATDNIELVGSSDVVVSEDASGYSGEADGRINETYTIRVLNGSESEDISKVVLSVTDSVGDVSTLSNITFDTPIAIGDRGATIEFSTGGAIATDFITDDTWTWNIAQAYTAPTATSGGTYGGVVDDTYIVEVTRGGDWNAVGPEDRPIVRVSTSRNTDTSTAVVGAAVLYVGTQGVTLEFSAGNGLLVAGDQWNIAVVAEALGDIRDLILSGDVPPALQGTPLRVELAIQESVEISKNRFQTPPLLNWEGDETTLTVFAGVQAQTTSGRTSDYLDVVAANIRVTYRALQTAIANRVFSLRDEPDIQGVLGPDLVDAVLAYGARRALAGAGGVEFLVLPIESDDLAGYQKAMGVLKERDDAYRIVPLSFDSEVHAAVIAEVNRRSTPTVGRWATAVIAKPLIKESQLVGQGVDEAASLATVTDPLGGTDYIEVHDDEGEFITRGIRPGDIVRTRYSTDGFGGSTFESYVVDNVVSENTLRLFSGPSTPVLTPALYEIWRNLSTAEQAEAWGRSIAFGNRRITAPFPPNPGRGGVRVPSYFLACTLAAYRCAAVPHQGLTNAEVPDWDDLEEASVTFADQLDNLANSGAYIVTQAPDGRVYIRKQLTTDLTDTKRAEDSATVNVDSMSYYFLDLLSPFVGRANVVPSAIKLIENKVNLGISFLVSNTFTEELGGQLTDGEIVYIRPHAVLADRLALRIRGDIPIPLNNGDMDLVV